jgi:riboflavin kinase/FMN adenylyltransferase
LTSLAQRTGLLKNEGIEAVIPLSFTPELAGLSARRFIMLLKKYLRIRALVIGADFVLGRGREGNVDTLGALGEELGFSVVVIPPVKNGGEVISSTAIRKALTDGDMNKAGSLLGRPFSIQGQVITGTGRGRELGFPTANLEIDPKQALPAEGVYASWAYLDSQAYQSMTNIGRCPTFGGSDRTVEVYLLNYDGNLYGRELKIDIVERLRDEKRFDTVDELKKQVAEDVKQGIAILSSQGRNQA